MCACREPSLTPRESIQWAAYVVVKTLAPIARAHPDPRVFEVLVQGMAEVEVEAKDNHQETTGGKPTTKTRTEHRGEGEGERPGPWRRPWYPLRYALGWLLLGELQREPEMIVTEGGGHGGESVSQPRSVDGGGSSYSKAEEGHRSARVTGKSPTDDDSICAWAVGLAVRLAGQAEGREKRGNEGQGERAEEERVVVATTPDEYSVNLFGSFHVRGNVDDNVRRYFFGSSQQSRD